MIPVAFEYRRAGSVDEALALLAEHGDEAKLLAGGHSLLPLMKLRLATPAVLVDVGRLRELSYIRDAGDHVAIGALTRHRDVETSTVLAEHAPVLAYATSLVGDPQVRHRGTIGGSLAHADPAADLPAVALALDATLIVRGPGGERQVPANEMFEGFLETAIGDDEMLTEIRVPKTGGGGWSYQKFTKRSADWAIVGVAAVHNAATGSTAVGLVNMGSKPLRASATEAALASGTAASEAAMVADEGTDPSSDLNAADDYRRHLARVLTRRALEEAGV